MIFIVRRWRGRSQRNGNVPFTLADDALDGEFLAQAEARGLFNLKGHRSVGGMRQYYNAVPLELVCKRW